MIYLVEDDESIRELVVYTLNSQGLEAQGFERPSLFWKALEKELPSLVLLDIMLPEEDGLSILKKIRIRPDVRKLPVIMLTAKGSEFDTVVGLDSGADDYIPKPFRMMELISRIKARLRRAEDKGAEEYHLEKGKFDITDVDKNLVERIPSATQIGKVYQRLIVDTAEPEEDYVDGILRVYNNKLCKIIDNYNCSAYYEPSYVIAKAYFNGCF